MQDLGTLGGDCGMASAINDAGVVIGAADFTPGVCDPNVGDPHAFVWRRGPKMTDLGTVPGDSCSEANSINSKGEIVGASRGCDFSTQHAVLWEEDQIIDLNMLIPPNSALYLTRANTINDRGEIGGIGNPPGCFSDPGCGHAFLLIPCDDDHRGIEGCDYSMVDAADVSNNAASPQFPLAIPLTMDSLTRTINPSQNWFRQHYRFLGQRPALRH
jgi:probable HAF family extracellular repeat protein